MNWIYSTGSENTQAPPETARCLFREFSARDTPGMFRLNMHPDIERFTTDPPFASETACMEFIRNYAAYRTTGFGRWSVLLKPGLVYAGWCGLKYLPDENVVDVGFRLLPEFWGMGIATETAVACCAHGFRQFGLRQIVARAHPDNSRSIRVIEKLGMQAKGQVQKNGIHWNHYELLRETFIPRKTG